MQANGADVTRSGTGRMQGESVWLSSVLCHPDIVWTEMDVAHVRANFNALGDRAELVLGLDRFGGLERVKFLRWGNTEGSEHHYSNRLGSCYTYCKYIQKINSICARKYFKRYKKPTLE